ncbi:MAG: hypothetical protein R3E47_05545 [Paracoccaceae bacterium]
MRQDSAPEGDHLADGLRPGWAQAQENRGGNRKNAAERALKHGSARQLKNGNPAGPVRSGYFKSEYYCQHTPFLPGPALAAGIQYTRSLPRIIWHMRMNPPIYLLSNQPA